MVPPPVDGRFVLAALRAGGLFTHQVEILTWYVDDQGIRLPTSKPESVRILAVAVLQDRLRTRAKEALQAKSYVLVDQPPYKGRHPTFVVLAE